MEVRRTNGLQDTLRGQVKPVEAERNATVEKVCT